MGLVRILTHLSYLMITASSHISPDHRANTRTISISTSSRDLAAALTLPRRRGNIWPASLRNRTPQMSDTSTIVLTPFGYLKRRGSANGNTPGRLEPIRVPTSIVESQDSLISLQPPLAETIFGVERAPVSAAFTSSVRSIGSLPSGLSRPGPRVSPGAGDLVSNSALMLLINSRANSTRTLADEIAISGHLIALEEIQRAGDTGMSTTLERQLGYIERIADQDMQRETLKLFVKDIVEKSGFLTEGTNRLSSADLARLMSLVDMLSDINNRFHQQSLVSGITTTNANPLDRPNISPTSRTNAIAPSSERISNALMSLSSNPGQPNVHDTSIPEKQHVLSSFKSRFGMNDALASLSSYSSSRVRAGAISSPKSMRERIREMVGKSIYGGRPLMIVRQIATTTKAPISKREPLGGSSGYWTHLRSGLADLLCRLCQQHKNQACIIRYCNNESNVP